MPVILRKKSILVFTCAVLLLAVSAVFALTKDEYEQYKKSCASIFQETFYDLPEGSAKDRLLTIEEQQAKGNMKIQRMMTSLEYAMTEDERLFKVLASRMKAEIVINDPGLASWNDRMIKGLHDSSEITRDTIELMRRAGGFEITQFNIVEKQVSIRISDNAHYHDQLREELKAMIRPYAADDRAMDTMLEGVPVHLYVESTWK